MILNLSHEGKSYKIPLDGKEELFLGKKIGDEVDIGLIAPGYKVRITGGSDTSGIPMRKDVHGSGKKYVLLSRGPGYRPKEKGVKKRKLVRGNTISNDIAQVNAVVIVVGETPLEELFKKSE
ncbi:MAG: 30S ribosomal protein S6e [Candidatus Micrarchaeota archaeon]|nr:30S ribosomal protein S6e [Candidatus Micrarchaeota archaeon]